MAVKARFIELTIINPLFELVVILQKLKVAVCKEPAPKSALLGERAPMPLAAAAFASA